MATDAVARAGIAPASAAQRRSLAVPLAVAVIALLPLLLAMPFLNAPMEQDEGVYFTVAAHGWPYGEVFDHKPPVVYGWYKLALLASGGEPNTEAARVLAAVSVSVAALAVAWTGAALFNRKTGLFAGFLLAIAMSNQYLQFNANSEAFMLAPLVLSLAGFVRGWQRSSIAWLAAAGALTGLATMTKSVGVLHLGALTATLMWGAAMGVVQWRVALRGAAALVGGCAAMMVVIAAPFVFGGRWDAFVYANVTYNRAYGALVGFEDKLFGLADVDTYALIAGLYLWVPAIIGAVLLCRKGASMAAGLLISGATAAFIGASVTGREYPHYLIPLLPFAALLAAYAIARMTEDWGDARARLHAEALLLMLAIPAIFALIPLYVLSTDDVHTRVYHKGPNAERGIANDELAAYVRAISSPGDRLFVFGDEAQLFALTSLRPATYHIRSIADAAVDGATFERSMTELEAAPPEIIIDSARIELSAGLLGRQGETVEIDAPEEMRAQMDAFLALHYRRGGHAEYADVWVLR